MPKNRPPLLLIAFVALIHGVALSSPDNILPTSKAGDFSKIFQVRTINIIEPPVENTNKIIEENKPIILAENTFDKTSPVVKSTSKSNKENTKQNKKSEKKPNNAKSSNISGVKIAKSANLDYSVIGNIKGIPFKSKAKLNWQTDNKNYNAQWILSIPLSRDRVQKSEGKISAAGLIPERYSEKSKSERAAHFDKNTGQIRFSANSPDIKLQAGAQDRLSTTLQIGAMIAAAPAKYNAGTKIIIQTAGVKSAEIWQWNILPDDILEINGQQIKTKRLLRTPRHEHDSKVELWLMKDYQYLPARLKITQAGGDMAQQTLDKLPL